MFVWLNFKSNLQIGSVSIECLKDFCEGISNHYYIEACNVKIKCQQNCVNIFLYSSVVLGIALNNEKAKGLPGTYMY